MNPPMAGILISGDSVYCRQEKRLAQSKSSLRLDLLERASYPSRRLDASGWLRDVARYLAQYCTRRIVPDK